MSRIVMFFCVTILSSAELENATSALFIIVLVALSGLRGFKFARM